jgi:hypothetical protein
VQRIVSLDSYGDRPGLTPRHWAVLGSLGFGRGPATPEIIARELGFELDDVLKMLADPEQAGFDLTPTRDR